MKIIILATSLMIGSTAIAGAEITATPRGPSSSKQTAGLQEMVDHLSCANFDQLSPTVLDGLAVEAESFASTSERSSLNGADGRDQRLVQATALADSITNISKLVRSCQSLEAVGEESCAKSFTVPSVYFCASLGALPTLLDSLATDAKSLASDGGTGEVPASLRNLSNFIGTTSKLRAR